MFLADVKGDLSGIARAGGDHPKVAERVKSLGLKDSSIRDIPSCSGTCSASKGHPVRATISEMGPLLLAGSSI